LCVENKTTESDSVTVEPITGPSSPIQVIDNTAQAEQTTPTPTQAQPTYATVSTCLNHDQILLDANEINAMLLKLTKSDSLPANVHNFVTCTEEKCSSLRNEKAAFKTDGSKDKFKHHWLSNNYWWACFLEDGEVQGMFCLLCLKHCSESSVNKTSNAFIDVPSKRYKLAALNDHKQSGIHARSIESERLQRMSTIHKDYEEKVEKEISVLKRVFSACYFVMKEHLPNTKFRPLLEMIEKQIGVSELKHFTHRSKGSIHDILICMGKAVKQMLLEDKRSANCYGLLIDEATDIATLSQLLCFIQYVNPSGCPEVKFLAIRNLLEEFDSCNAEAIVETVLKVLEENDLDVSELSGLATDGANVMLGKDNGVAVKLKERNPELINIHSICHKLALACVDTVSELNYIKFIETTLRQLWQWLEN